MATKALRTGKYNYTTVCKGCGQSFVYYRNTPLSGNQQRDDPRRYCDVCLPNYSGMNGSLHMRRELFYTTKDGYRMVRQNGGNLVSEHRMVMEQVLGRPLVKGESVHHKNGRREDNRPDNLELWLKPQQLAGQRASDVVCPHCGKPYSSPL
ncbi:hypothetical protein LCGC14_1834480 [marine sediment metagenome]|uniref:HNH nuclease domain-containing protein n=1 Tax=marine sediment metagenome TaxID=412755 RepID=A0A0F9H396_9ZZZZ